MIQVPIWIGIVLLSLLLFIAFDHGRLIVTARRFAQIIAEERAPVRGMVIGTIGSGDYMSKLSQTFLKARKNAGISITEYTEDKATGLLKVVFDNDDELWVYSCYEEAQIHTLTERQKSGYVHQLFLDSKLPDGAHAAIIKSLGLLDYMISTGLCTKKSGG